LVEDFIYFFSFGVKMGAFPFLTLIARPAGYKDGGT